MGIFFSFLSVIFAVVFISVASFYFIIRLLFAKIKNSVSKKDLNKEIYNKVMS